MMLISDINVVSGSREHKIRIVFDLMATTLHENAAILIFSNLKDVVFVSQSCRLVRGRSDPCKIYLVSSFGTEIAISLKELPVSGGSGANFMSIWPNIDESRLTRSPKPLAQFVMKSCVMANGCKAKGVSRSRLSKASVKNSDSTSRINAAYFSFFPINTIVCTAEPCSIRRCNRLRPWSSNFSIFAVTYTSSGLLYFGIKSPVVFVYLV